MIRFFRWIFVILGILNVFLGTVMWYYNMPTKPLTNLLASINYLLLAGLYFRSED